MKLVHTALDVPSANFIRQVLQDNGIPSMVQGDGVLSVSPKASGTYPTVWVSNDEDFARACEILSALARPQSDRQAPPGTWTCRKCGEDNGPEFSECWRCAKNLEEDSAAADPQTRKLKTAFAAALFMALACGFLSFFLSAMLPADVPASQNWMKQVVSLTRLFCVFLCLFAFYFAVRLAASVNSDGQSKPNR